MYLHLPPAQQMALEIENLKIQLLSVYDLVSMTLVDAHDWMMMEYIVDQSFDSTGLK